MSGCGPPDRRSSPTSLSCRRVAIDEQAGGEHNLSIALTSLAYHLKVLSSVEKCVLAREAADAAAAAKVAERQQGRAS
jgi:hypothetical protein